MKKRSAPGMGTSESRFLARNALTDALGKAVEDYKLVVLSAPMGYGKTTAARELARALDWRSFFITLNPGAHNAFYLWDRACGQMMTQGSGMAPVMSAWGFPQDPGEMQRILDHGREYLSGRPTLVVIDDYHNVDAPAVDFFLESMVREEMPGLCLMLLSRTKPRLSLEDLCLKRLATVFDKSVLAFTQEDAARLFFLHGIDDPETAEKAWMLSEGWPAALWLCLQSYQAHGALAPEHNVEGLLESAVFSRYSAEERQLLLQLCLLPRFTPRQAAAVANDSSAPRKLLLLHEKNAFLNYDPATDTYSLHSLFRGFLIKFLRGKADALSASIDPTLLSRRIAQWHDAENDTLEAVRAYARAGKDEDLLAVLDIFARPSDGLLVMFDPRAIKDLCVSIPWHVRVQRPIGYLAFIYHYMTRVNIAEGATLLEEAEKRFAREPAIPEEEKRRIKGEITLIRSILAFNDLFAMRDIHEEAHRLLDGRSAISHRQLIWTVGSPHAAFVYLRTPGTYRAMVKLIEENLHFFHDMADGCSMGAEYIFRAEYLLELGHFKQVEAYLTKAVYRATSKEQHSTYIAARFTLARLMAATGQIGKAAEVMEELAPLASKAGPLLANALDAGRGYIMANLGKREAIPRWLREGKLTVSGIFFQGGLFSLVVHGKSLILKKDWLRLEVFAQELPGLMGGCSQVFVDIHGGVLAAVAAYHLDGIERGTELFRTALEIARQDGIMLSLAEYGKHVVPLLRHILTENPKDRFCRGILRQARRSAPGTGGEQARTTLKDREKLLLSLAAQGKSNGEIAEHLGIGEAAVKKSFTALYRKLGVRGRLEAVQQYSIMSESGRG